MAHPLSSLRTRVVALRPHGRLGTWSTRAGYATLAVAAALLARAPGLSRGLFDPDEGALATMGMVVSRGGVLYRDVIDRKPPLAPLLYGLVFWVTGSRRLEPLHVVAALELAAAALLVAMEVRRRAGPRAAWWAAGLLIAGAIALRPADAQAANYSHLALLPGTGAIVAARRGTWRSAAVAGLLLGAATLTRQTWVIGVLPAVVATWFHGPAPDRLRRAATVVAVTVATVAIVGLAFPFGPFFHWTFSGNGGLLFGFSQAQSPIGRGLQAVELFVVAHLALCFLAIRRGWHREDLDLWLWLLTGLAAFSAGFRYFGHYWLQVLPPLCLLAAPAIVSCRSWLRAALVVLVLAPTAVYWVQAWHPIHGPSNIDQRAFPIVRAVRRSTTTDDLITVWGSFPEIYWLSGRDPGGALVISDFIVGRTAGRPDGPQRLKDATPGALDDFLASLRAHPPKLFIDTATGHVRKYGHYPLSLVPPVQRFVRQHYRPVAHVAGGVTIYERVPSRPRPAAGPRG